MGGAYYLILRERERERERKRMRERERERFVLSKPMVSTGVYIIHTILCTRGCTS